MKNILKILKINILSLLALPLLLLATTSRFIAKALKKIGPMLGMSLFTIALILLFEAIKAPHSIFLRILILILFIIVLGALIFAIHFLHPYTILVRQYFILCFETIYDFTHNLYLKLYDSCTNDYHLLVLQSEQNVSMAACLFYTLLRGIHRLIAGFTSISLYLAMIGCGIITIGSIIHINSRTQTLLGLNLFRYLSKFDTLAVINGVTVYLAIIATICTVLLCLGIEWHKWSLELKMNPAESAENTKDAKKLQESILPSSFFAGCNTIEKLDKRYKSLCKTYHPDAAEGDEETFKTIRAEYETLKELL